VPIQEDVDLISIPSAIGTASVAEGHILALRFGGLAIILRFLADSDAHDLDGVADHTGGALFAIGASWHNSFSGYKLLLCVMCEG
jgi:hypothetical protein